MPAGLPVSEALSDARASGEDVSECQRRHETVLGPTESRREMKHAIDRVPRTLTGRLPIGTVYFSHATDAWMRRLPGWGAEIIATAEETWGVNR